MSRSEAVLREAIEQRTRKLESDMGNLPEGAADLPEGMLTALIELDDLRSQLQFLLDHGRGPGEAEAYAAAPQKPRPRSHSGAIALPEPDEPEI